MLAASLLPAVERLIHIFTCVAKTRHQQNMAKKAKAASGGAYFPPPGTPWREKGHGSSQAVGSSARFLPLQGALAYSLRLRR